MNISVIVLPAVAILLALTPAWAAKKKTMEETIKDSQNAANEMVADMARKKEAEKKATEDYWDAQPDAPAVLPGKLLETLKKLPWPDMRPVPKERYFPRPEVKTEAPAADEDDDPLMAGYGKKENAAKLDLQAAQKESDDARFELWLRNFTFFLRGVDDCETGKLSGPGRVKLLESAQVFIKEGEPRYYLLSTADRGANKLKEMEAAIKALISKLEKEGQYVPDYRAMEMAEKIGVRLAFETGEPLTEKEKQRYYKVVDRLVRLDPRAPEAQAQGAGVKTAAGGGAKDAKWEEFLAGLIVENNKILSGLNFAAQPAVYPALIAKIEKEISALLASFPPGWQKYPRAKWAHDWHSGALEKSGAISDPAVKGKELFIALNDFETGLK